MLRSMWSEGISDRDYLDQFAGEPEEDEEDEQDEEPDAEA